VLLVALERAVVVVVVVVVVAVVAVVAVAGSPRADVPGVGRDYAPKWSARTRMLRREEGDPCVGRRWWVFRLLV